MTDKSRQDLYLSIFSIAISLCFSSSVYAGKPIAEVYRVFGKVTQLRPGDLIARRVKQGDKISVDTSIVTSKKSFVQIVYYNGGSANIGPTSKAVISETSKKKKGVIGLLKGTVRSNFQDPSVRKSDDLKFFIKTKTAALGVRGTDFQTIYNPENNVTNLLTFKGEVNMVRVEAKSKKKRKKKRGKKSRSKKRRVKSRVYGHSVSDQSIDLEVEEIEFTDKQIEGFIDNSEEKVAVKAGQYSAVLPALDRASMPVKISPVQLKVLQVNSGMIVKDDKKTIKPYDLKSVDATKLAMSAKQSAPPEGYFNESTGEYAPKAGGFIDLKTGLYIQPSTHSVYDERLGVYVENKLGSIDQETGQYLPPKGLKVHPKKGFVPSSKKMAKNPKIMAMAKSLNNEIQLDALADKKTSVTELVSSSLYNEQELYSKNILTVRYITGSQSSTTTGDTQVGDSEYASTSRSGYRLLWDIASNSFWRPYSFFESQSITMDNGGGKAVVNTATKSVEIGAGIRFYQQDRLNYYAQFGFDQNIMLQHKRNSSDTLVSGFDRLTRLKFLGGVDYVVVKSKRYDLRVNGFLGFLPSSTKETLEMGATFSWGFKTYFNYWYKRDIRLNLGLEYENVSMNLIFPDATYDHSVSLMTPVLSVTKVF
jgi:hypothetical protein